MDLVSASATAQGVKRRRGGPATETHVPLDVLGMVAERMRGERDAGVTCLLLSAIRSGTAALGARGSCRGMRLALDELHESYAEKVADALPFVCRHPSTPPDEACMCAGRAGVERAVDRLAALMPGAREVAGALGLQIAWSIAYHRLAADGGTVSTHWRSDGATVRKRDGGVRRETSDKVSLYVELSLADAGEGRTPFKRANYLVLSIAGHPDDNHEPCIGNPVMRQIVGGDRFASAVRLVKLAMYDVAVACALTDAVGIGRHLGRSNARFLSGKWTCSLAADAPTRQGFDAAAADAAAMEVASRCRDPSSRGDVVFEHLVLLAHSLQAEGATVHAFATFPGYARRATYSVASTWTIERSRTPGAADVAWGEGRSRVPLTLELHVSDTNRVESSVRVLFSAHRVSGERKAGADPEARRFHRRIVARMREGGHATSLLVALFFATVAGPRLDAARSLVGRVDLEDLMSHVSGGHLDAPVVAKDGR